MRISLILLFSVILQLSAADGYAQRTREPIALSNVTVEQVLNIIEKNSDYVFLYNENAIEIKRLVSVNSKKGDIREILDAVFTKTNVKYNIIDKQIILSAQKQNISENDTNLRGVVRDVNGEPLIGVTVQLKGANQGTITGIDGDFSLKAYKGSVLVVSYIGYATQEIKVVEDQYINIILKEDTKVLDEVVVTALGIKKQTKALGYSIQEVKGSELTSVKDPNFVNSLAGKVAGVTINASSAGVGGATKVVMRGAKSITKSNNAMYVIDGIPMFNSEPDIKDGLTNGVTKGEGISDLNPEDIESMSILTGPSAAALYGSNAANGVILVTTKKGIEGKAKISFSQSTSFMSPFVKPEFQNTYGNVSGEYASWGDKLAIPSAFDPMKFFRTGYNESTSLTVSTGTTKNQTFMSVAHTMAEGIIPNNEYGRLNVTLRNTSKLFNDKLTADFSTSYINQNDQNLLSQGSYFNPLIPLYLFPRGEDFNSVRAYERFDEARNMHTQNWAYGEEGSMAMQNPYWVINRNMTTTERQRYMFNISLKYDILPWLNVSARGRMDNSISVNEDKRYAGTIGKFAESKGFYGKTNVKDRQTYGDIMLNLNKLIGDFDLAASLGGSYLDSRSETDEIRGQLKSVTNYFYTNNINPTAGNSGVVYDGWHEQNQSVFATAQLGYKSMLYLNVTGRNDWSSALAFTDTKSFFYPSVSLSAVVSQMVKLPEWFSFLKVRGSYSNVGSAPERYSTRDYYTIANDGLSISNVKPVDEMKPENTVSYEAGLNAKFFGNKINLDFTYYRSNTYNQTFTMALSPGSAWAYRKIQTGNVRNHGIEVALGLDQALGPVNWNTQVTYGLNRNKIMELVNNFIVSETGEVLNLRRMEQKINGTCQMILTEGGTMGDIYTLNQLKEDGNGNIYTDGITLSSVNKEQKVGTVDPSGNLGWRNSFEYNGLSLSFLITARFGGVVLSSTQAIMDQYGVSNTSAIARDNGGVPINDGMFNAKTYYQTVGGGMTGMLSQYVYSATNVRLQEVALNYQLPKKWFKNKVGISMSLTGRNLFMFYNKAPFDPESVASTGTYNQGLDFFMPPSMRSVGYSLTLKF